MSTSRFDFSRLSNAEILTRFGKVVQTERKITHYVLQFIAEIDARRIYLDKAYPSLYEFLKEEYGYTSSAAIRRISSAKLLREVPEVIEKIESGALNLSQLCQVQQAVRAAQKVEDRTMSSTEKRELLTLVENSTQEQTDVILSQTLSLPIVYEDKEKQNADGSVTLTVTLAKEEIAIVRQARDLISHSVPEKKWSKAITHLAQKEVTKRTQVSKRNISFLEKDIKAPSHSHPNRSNLKSNSRKQLSTSHKKFILKRDKCCQYKDKETGKTCASTRFLQNDHRQSVWAGGSNEIRNLQILCAQHNQHKYRLERLGK